MSGTMDAATLAVLGFGGVAFFLGLSAGYRAHETGWEFNKGATHTWLSAGAYGSVAVMLYGIYHLFH